MSMKRRRPNPKVVVFGLLVLAMLLYRQFLYRPDIVRPSPWQISISAGLRATDAGRFDEAERHFQSAMHEADTFEERDPRRGTTLHNTGYLRLRQKRFAEAEPFYLKALPLLETGRPDHELEVAAVLEGLATVHASRQEFAEAETLLRRQIEINQRHLGKSDPAVANGLRALSVILIAQGKLADAMTPVTQATAITRKRAAPAATTQSSPGE